MKILLVEDSQMIVKAIKFLLEEHNYDVSVASTIKDAKEGSLNYAVGPIISKRSYIGWTTNGHTGEEVALYSYHPKDKTLDGLVQNTDVAKYIEEVLGLNLGKANEKLYNNIVPVLENAGLNYYWNNGDFVNPELIITDGTNNLSIPSNKNYYILNGKKINSTGVNIFVNGDNFYVSKEVIDLFPKN